MTFIVRYRDLPRKLTLPHAIWQGAHLSGAPWAHATHLMFQLRQRAVNSRLLAVVQLGRWPVRVRSVASLAVYTLTQLTLQHTHLTSTRR